MKHLLAILGILSVTFAAATDFVVLAVFQWNFVGDDGLVYSLASISGVLSTLAWWVGVVLIGFATMVRDRRALQLPASDSPSPPSA
ncbi:MAG TPA: hypothetical protein VGN57_19765 [Pirellulaceae bacterium]|jgi:hypothetical protein|nr:hypothetical protein [Pirellulaceae bacterium]